MSLFLSVDPALFVSKPYPTTTMLKNTNLVNLVALDHPNPRDTVSLDCGINFRPYCSISDYGPIDGPHPNDSDENMLDINCLDNASIRRRLIISNQKL